MNSTFLGSHDLRSRKRGWNVSSGLRVSLKLYQKFTHPRMFRNAALARAPGSEGPLLDLLSQVTRSDLDEFRAGIEPLAAAGRLGALLAQFPAASRMIGSHRTISRACCARLSTTRLPSSSVTRAGAMLLARR